MRMKNVFVLACVCVGGCAVPHDGPAPWWWPTPFITQNTAENKPDVKRGDPATMPFAGMDPSLETGPAVQPSVPDNVLATQPSNAQVP